MFGVAVWYDETDMKNPFEMRIRSKIEENQNQDSIDVLLGEFPESLRDRLEAEIEGLDDQGAEDLLMNKLVARREALVEWRLEDLSKMVEVTHEVPLGVLASIERSAQEGPTSMLGQGMNGRVYESVRKEFACYKVLFLERARQLQLNIIREATLQHDISEILQKDPTVAQVPEVIGFVEHSEVIAIMMNKINGASLLQIFEGKAELPEGFDLKTFFDKLERAVLLMNQHGYYHRDLTNNSGNVMIDVEGNPWIVDFGSAIKAMHPSDNDQVFQLKPGGAHILASDLSGVHKLKEKVIEYLRAKEYK